MAKSLLAVSVLFLIAGLFLYSQAFGATSGYPGPPGRPTIPTGPPIGPVGPGQTAGPSYVCGFQPGTSITFQVNGVTLAGTGRAESNGCIEFVVAVAGCPTITVNTFSLATPISLGPVNGLWGANTVAATGLGVSWGPYHGQNIGLSIPLQILGPTPECGGTTTTSTTAGPNTSTTKPTTTTTKPTTSTTKPTTSTTRPHVTPTTRPTGPTTTTLAPFNPNKAPLTTKQKAAVAFLIGAGATAAAAAGASGGAAAGASGSGGGGGGGGGGSPRRPTGQTEDAKAGTRARGSSGKSGNSKAGTQSKRTTAQSGDDPQAGTRARGSRIRNSGADGLGEGSGPNSFTTGPGGGGA